MHLAPPLVRAARAAGVPGSGHGVRKLAATRDAQNGATEAQLEAKYGWSGGKMASLYTRSANRKRLAVKSTNWRETPDRTNSVLLFPHHPTVAPVA
jgi:hypothetical protein